MAFTKLTTEGKAFIRYYCRGTGNSCLRGNMGLLQGQLSGTEKPQLSPNYVWVATVYDDSGKQITTDEQLGEQLIIWYNRYAEEYKIDANIIAAQGFAESAYKVWVYPQTSTASGISQFTIDTLIDMVMKNISSVEPKFTQDEIAKIFDVGIEPINMRRKEIAYKVKINEVENEVGMANRAQLHQNVINNPKIMIKAQCRLMKRIASHCDSYANWSLFAYAAGLKYSKMVKKWQVNTFTQAIQLAQRDGNKHEEGVEYIFRIFSFLGDKYNVNTNKKEKGYWFGYSSDKLRGLNNESINMGVSLTEQLKYFDAHAVDTKNTNTNTAYADEGKTKTNESETN